MNLRFPAVLLMCALAACVRLGGGGQAPLHLYTLHPTVPASAFSTTGLGGVSVGIGPVELPDYLQRSQVVTLAGPNEYRLAPGGRWAEPLEENLTRVLAENLTRLTGSERIFTFPWRSSLRPDFRVRLNVLRFETDDKGVAHLTARWTIEPPEPAEADSGRFEEEVSVDGEWTKEAVAAMAESVGLLSRELAGRLKKAASGEGPP